MKRYLYIGILGCLVAVGAIVLTYWQTEDHLPESKLAVDGSAEDSRVTRNARGTGIPVPAPPPVAAFGTDRAHPEKAPAADTMAGDGKTGSAGTAQPRQEKPDSTAGVSMPVFDVVRVNPEGDALIAGRAPVGAEVGIYDGDKRTGTAIADGRGEWVYLPGKPLPPGQREISLSLIGKDGTETRSESVVVLMVPDQNLAKAPVSASMPQDGAEKKSEGVLAVLVAREGNAPSRVLQKPSEAQGLGDKALSIDVIDYDASEAYELDEAPVVMTDALTLSVTIPSSDYDGLDEDRCSVGEWVTRTSAGVYAVVTAEDFQRDYERIP